jgi:hypothetical protein
MKILILGKYFNQSQHSLVMLIVSLHCDWYHCVTVRQNVGKKQMVSAKVGDANRKKSRLDNVV